MERDGHVFAIGEDVDICGGVDKMTRGLAERFGRGTLKGLDFRLPSEVRPCQAPEI